VGAEVVVQEDFQQHGRTLLEKLEQYIASCDRVIALVGDAYGWEPDLNAEAAPLRRSYTQWEYFFAQGERLQDEPQPPIDTYVYLASRNFLATHPVTQDPDNAKQQQAFVTLLRSSGKDWNQFSSTDELRALVLRDGFRLPSANREPLIDQIAKIFNIRLASADNPRLTPILTRRLRPVLDRHVLFGGRTAELDWLDTQLREHTSGYLFVTGRSGFGKTALLANWVKQLTHDNRPVCYHFISRVDQTAGEEFALRCLCQQLASHHGLSGELPADTDRLRALYPDLLSLPPQIQQLVIVLDGLDEAVGWTPGADLFPDPLPPGVFVVFSAREIAGRAWLDELGLGASDAELLNLSTLSAAGIVHLLQRRESSAAQWADDVTFVDLMWRKSGGDPFYVSLLVKDLENGLIRSHEDLERLPSGLNDYLNKWWQDVSQVTGDEAVRDLLGYLLVSKGRMTRDDLTNISEDDSLDDWGFDRTIILLERYIVGNDAEGYTLAHPRFQEYVAREKIKIGAQRPYRERLLAYCRRWREHKSRYSLSQYTAHLVEHGQWAELHSLLTRGEKGIEWADTRHEIEGSHAGYLLDLNIGRAATMELGAEAIGLQVRYMLIESTIRTLSGNVPPGLVGVLVPRVWNQAQAIGHVRSLPGDRDRSATLRAIMPTLDEGHRLEAWNIAKEIADPNLRIESLSALCALLPLDHQRQLLHEVAGTEDENERARTVAALARHLKSDLQSDALEIVTRIQDEIARTSALVEMAPCLRTDDQEVVLMTVMDMKNERLRCVALGRLAATLPPSVTDAVLGFIDQIETDVIHAKTQMTWVRHWPEDLRLELLGSRLTDKHRASDSKLVEILLPILPDGDAKRSLTDFQTGVAAMLARFDWDEPDESAASTLQYIQAVRDMLDRILAVVPEETRGAVLNHARLARSRRRMITFVLTGIADSLDESLHTDAIEAARSIRDASSRIRSCARLARCLGEEQGVTLLREALAGAAAIDDEENLANTLYCFYDCLPERLRIGPWTKTDSLDGDDRRAFVRWATANAWLDYGQLWIGTDSPEPTGPSKILQVAEHLPEPLKQHVAAAVEADAQGRAPRDAFAALASALPSEWLRAMRGRGNLPPLPRLSILSDDLIELEAAQHPEVAKNLREVRRGLGELWASSSAAQLDRRAIHALIRALPESIRVQVARLTLAASRRIGGSGKNAMACVRLVRHVSHNLTAHVVNEALTRLDAIEDGRSRHDFEKLLLELLYQVPAAHLPEVLARVQAEPDSWIRARVLCNASGPLLARVQEQALAILVSLDENSLVVGLRLMAALDDDLQQRALERVRQVANIGNRTEILADLTLALSPNLRNEVTRETFETVRQVDESEREWRLQNLAKRLPEEARFEVVAIAREMNDASLRSRALIMIAPDLPDPLRTEVGLEALRLLPEFGEAWKCQQVLEHAAVLPAAVQEQAVAAARAVIEETQQPEILCELAAGMALPRQQQVQEEALMTARRLEDRWKRVAVLAHICEYLPLEHRTAIATEAWDALIELASAKHPEQGDEILWRLSTLTALLPHLPDNLVGPAANQALQIVKGQADNERQRWADRLRRALEESKKPAEPRGPLAGSRRMQGEPTTIVQLDLRAITLVTHMARNAGPTIKDLRDVLSAVEAANSRLELLRQTIRCQTDRLSDDALTELSKAVEVAGTESLYLELSEKVTDEAKSRFLAKALSADQYRAGKKASIEMVTAWEAKQFDTDVGRSLLSSRLADTAMTNRQEAIDELTAMIPLMAHLFGRPAVDATFEAFCDVTAWWP
jgi:hypothetical protein